jgi:hypothetical protein
MIHSMDFRERDDGMIQEGHALCQSSSELLAQSILLRRERLGGRDH